MIYVEPNNMIGWTSKYTDSTMIISTKVYLSKYNTQQILQKFENIWIDNGEYEAHTIDKLKKISYNSIIKRQLKVTQSMCANDKQIYFILPDKMYNIVETIGLYYKYKNIINKFTSQHNNITQVFVLQATSPILVDWAFSHINNNFNNDKNIGMFAIPKKIRELNNWNELKLAILGYITPDKIHYLGFTSGDVHDDIIDKIHSLDTKHPIKHILGDYVLESNDSEYIENEYFNIPIQSPSLKIKLMYEIEQFEKLFNKQNGN